MNRNECSASAAAQMRATRCDTCVRKSSCIRLFTAQYRQYSIFTQIIKRLWNDENLQAPHVANGGEAVYCHSGGAPNVRREQNVAERKATADEMRRTRERMPSVEQCGRAGGLRVRIEGGALQLSSVQCSSTVVGGQRVVSCRVPQVRLEVGERERNGQRSGREPHVRQHRVRQHQREETQVYTHTHTHICLLNYSVALRCVHF